MPSDDFSLFLLSEFSLCFDFLEACLQSAHNVLARHPIWFQAGYCKVFGLCTAAEQNTGG